MTAAGFRVATYNVNDVRARLPNLLSWLAATRPDVACLQELKCSDASFPADALARAGYGAAWHGEGRWNGVAILARGADPVVTRRRLPGDPGDRQARYIEAAVGGVLVGNLYAPNGNPQPGPKFTYKLAWLERLLDHAATLHAAGVPAVLAGDYNVVPTDDDIYPSRSWAGNALVQPAPRALFAALLAAGWTDALEAAEAGTARTGTAKTGMVRTGRATYTFWSYLRHRFERDAGMRIDHLLLTPALAPRLRAAGVDRDTRAAPGASDHAPAWAELSPTHDPVPTRRRR